MGPMYLFLLPQSILGFEVRKKGSPHNCLDDAHAAMKLVLAKIEREVGDTIPSVQEDVPETDMAKLLHRIPRTMSSEQLQNAIPGNFTLEVKRPSMKAKGDIYSALLYLRINKKRIKHIKKSKAARKRTRVDGCKSLLN